MINLAPLLCTLTENRGLLLIIGVPTVSQRAAHIPFPYGNRVGLSDKPDRVRYVYLRYIASRFQREVRKRAESLVDRGRFALPFDACKATVLLLDEQPTLNFFWNPVMVPFCFFQLTDAFVSHFAGDVHRRGELN
jgi:hypothetical protein